MALTPFSPGHQSTVFDSFFLDVWDPSKDLPFFFSAVSIPSSNMGAATTQFAAIHIDWSETQEAHVFRANLPGMRKEEVKVEVEDGRVLKISGESNRDNEEQGDHWHHVERSSGRFVRRFRLPENAKMERVSANMENGVLTVTVPKEDVKRRKVKSIKIGGGGKGGKLRWLGA